MNCIPFLIFLIDFKSAFVIYLFKPLLGELQ